LNECLIKVAGKVVFFIGGSGQALITVKDVDCCFASAASPFEGVQGKGCSSYRVNRKPWVLALKLGLCVALSQWLRLKVHPLHEN
jgi:hypothetical protein